MLVRILLAVVMATGAAAQRGPAPSAEPFILGVLQTNGSLIPFATYDGGKWANAWPAPAQNPGVPESALGSFSSLASLPKSWTSGLLIPKQWHLWLSGGTAHAVNVDRPRFVDSACSQNWVLSTDFPARLLQTCPRCCPVGIVGVAVSTSRELAPSVVAGRRVDPPASVVRDLLALEPAEARRPAANPLRIDHLWKLGDDLFYVDAKRTIPNLDSSGATPVIIPDSCHGISLFRAWYRSDWKDQVRVASTHYEASDCDTKGSHSYVPLGLMTIGNVSYVIVQRNGWEEQAFGVLRIDATSVKTMVMTDIR